MKTPMSSDTKLTKDEEYESVDSTKYRGMIGSLLYLTSSRPDIMFSVCLCARFQEDPKTSHLDAVKSIFRCIKGTTHVGLWYPMGTSIETVVYADSDHARDYVDRKSTSGIYTFVGCYLTSWFSKKQTTLSISTTEAEYVIAGKCNGSMLHVPTTLGTVEVESYNFERSLLLSPYNRSTFLGSTVEPVDEDVVVKVNDETKWFRLTLSIEENNALDATLSDQPLLDWKLTRWLMMVMAR
ncbi:hypothetical protein Tco_1519089 [Tanacetum coccineum]